MFKKDPMRYMRIICLLLVFAISLTHIPTTMIMADPTPAVIPDYALVEVDGGKELQVHGDMKDIPLLDFIDAFGFKDLSEAMVRITKDGEVVFSTADFVTDYVTNLDWKGLASLLLAGNTDAMLEQITDGAKIAAFEQDTQYKIEIGTVDLSLQPFDISVNYTKEYTFVPKSFDVLTVDVNKAGVVAVDGFVVDDHVDLCIFRGEEPVVTIGEVKNHAVYANMDGQPMTLAVDGTYTFAGGLTKDVAIDVLYVESMESTIVNSATTTKATASIAQTVPFNTDVLFSITPVSGHRVVNVSVMDGETAMAISGEFANGVFTGKFTTHGTKTQYTLNYNAKPVIVMNGSAIVFADTMTADEIREAILALVDFDATPGLSKDMITVQYDASNVSALTKQWKDIEFAPDGVNQLAMHKFGANDSETIKLIYTGASEFAAGEFEATIALSDTRKTTATIDANDEVSVVYGKFTNEELIEKLLKDKKGVVDSETGVAIEGAQFKFNTDVTELFVGTHEVKLMFVGNNEYMGCEKTITLTVSKAVTELKINSSIVDAPASISMHDVIDIPDNVSYITAMIGVDVIDGKNKTYIDLSSLVHTVDILQPVVDKIMGAADNKTFTIEELRSLLKTIKEVDNKIDLDALTAFASLLEKIEKMEAIQNLEITLITKGKVEVDNVGVYLIAAMTSDYNYDLDFDLGYVVIKPALTEVSLSFNENHGGIVIHNDVLDGKVDFGAHVAEDAHKAAEELINHIFFGVTLDGDIYLDDEACAKIGAYSQMTYIIPEFDNIIYYAKPIVRAFVITPENVDIIFVNSNGEEITDFEFVYDGQAKDITAIVKDRDGNVLSNDKLSMRFVGLTAGGKKYNETTAPADAGVYAITAIYKDASTKMIGIAARELIIKKAVSAFGLEDATVKHDGQGHFVTVNNPDNMMYITVTIAGKKANIALGGVVDGVETIETTLPELFEKAMESEDVQMVVGAVEQLMAELDLNQYPEAQTIIEEVKALIEQASEYQIAINGVNPDALGTYNVFAVAFDANYKTVMDTATLQIVEEIEEPKDPSDPSNPEDPTTPGGSEEPTTPGGSEEPTDPEEPKDDNETETPKLGFETTTATNLWSMISLASLFMIVAEIIAMKPKKRRK